LHACGKGVADYNETGQIRGAAVILSGSNDGQDQDETKGERYVFRLEQMWTS
jgi:hypothetical protein